MSAPSILNEIVHSKSRELETQKSLVSMNELERSISTQSPAIDFKQALSNSNVALIAEIKKASPSKGLLCPDFEPVRLADTYAKNGASAISVLTDPRFQGELDHIVSIKNSGASGNLPILRKDFIFDPYQIAETRAAGADAMLLIVAILEPTQLKELLTAAQEHWMHCLVEVHDEAELDKAMEAGAEVVGINNRDLRLSLIHI